MIDKLMQALDEHKITTVELQAAEKFLRFMADSLKETLVELEIKGYDNELERLIRDRQVIPAIKLYRSKTNTGLKEAKDYVEQIGERLGVYKRGGGGWSKY